MEIKKIYENPHILHEGTLPKRSSFQSYQIENDKTSSLSLNGEWSFSFYDSVKNANLALKNNSHRNNSQKITVPSTWQHLGYDAPQYINTRYPFPADAPYVPAKNPVGIYEKKISINKDNIEKTVILRFDGVDSCFFLYINEKYAGYSQVSHSMSEFDITKFLSEGENLITVCVLKWCDGSYLECQDKFRESGIFRDVDLLFRPKDYIFDYTVKTELSGNLDNAKIFIEADKAYPFNITCSINYDDQEIAETIFNGNHAELTIDRPKLWNAEQPYLYTLILQTPFEKIVDHVGFRKIELKKGIFYLNNVACKLRGVNYHDSNPYLGARLTKEQAVSDLKLMKEANINAIRTSHYPKPHWFMDMCDKYGFYIVDEADIETHGASHFYTNHERDISYLSRNPEYRDAYLDRIELLYERDKNHPSVLLWSLGNESGYGENFIEGARYLHSKKDERPVHYEGTDREYSFSLPVNEIDVYSNMYASPEAVNKYCTKNKMRSKRPYMQCEFCHAMGNGPGDLEENVNQLYTLEHYFGAFVWEWCDHAVYDGTDEKGIEHFLYGGDNKETYHDGNFCMDGLVYPNRIPHTGYKEYKNVLRPARLISFNRNNMTAVFENKYDFANLSDKIEISYEIKEYGKTRENGSISLPDTPAHSHVEIALPCKPLNDSEYIIFRYKNKIATELVEKDKELGTDEVLPIAKQDFSLLAPEVANSLKNDSKQSITDSIELHETEYEIIIHGSNFKYTFDKELGSFTGLNVNGNEVITKPVEFNIQRAYIDNDRNIHRNWESCGYNDTALKVYNISCEKVNNAVTITLFAGLAAPCREPALRINAKWIVSEAGNLSLDLSAKRNMDMDYLPRFGLKMFIQKGFENVDYFGYGPNESYIDKHRSCLLDFYHTNKKALHEDYVRPQENGSHYGTEYLKISNKNSSLFFTAADAFSFNVSDFTDEELIKKAHNYELEESPDTVLCIDYKMSGCGSNSCGPELNEKYRLCEENINWKLNIILK